MNETRTRKVTTRVPVVLLWVLIAASPLISVLIICIVTGTSLGALDAWSSSWNDEMRYFWSVTQMRLYGHPCGTPGYNEVVTQWPSYGPYSVTVYGLYYLGSFVSGFGSHNFMYVLNMAFGVIAAAVVAFAVRPDVRASLHLIVLLVFQFVIARYICSGMTEASYVLFAACFTSLAFCLQKRSTAPEDKRRYVVLYCAMIACLAIWGSMRPYLLAFVLVPLCMLFVGQNHVGKKGKIGLVLISFVVAGAVLVVYWLQSKYMMTPYFYKGTIANSIFDRLASALPALPGAHLRCIAFSGRQLIKLHWQGIMVFAFFICWVVLLIQCVRAHRSKERTRFAFLLSLLLVGFIIFEAHLLLYDYKHMHRTMMAVIVIYLLSVVLLESGRTLKRPVSLASGAVLLTSLVCVVALVALPLEFSLPQVPKNYDAAAEQAQHEQFERLMPEDPSGGWENTIAHPPENSGFRIYYNIPTYMNMNSCKKEFLEKAITEGTLKSKYLCLPATGSLNKLAAEHYEKIYEGSGHIIYKTR